MKIFFEGMFWKWKIMSIFVVNDVIELFSNGKLPKHKLFAGSSSLPTFSYVVVSEAPGHFLTCKTTTK